MAIRDSITKDEHFYTGEDKSLVFTIYESDGVTPQDITGWTLSYRWKRMPGDADSESVIAKTTSAGIALTTPGSGICTVTIDDTDTDTLEAREYYHELKRTTPGSETVLTIGIVAIQQAMHRE